MTRRQRLIGFGIFTLLAVILLWYGSVVQKRLSAEELQLVGTWSEDDELENKDGPSYRRTFAPDGTTTQWSVDKTTGEWIPEHDHFRWAIEDGQIKLSWPRSFPNSLLVVSTPPPISTVFIRFIDQDTFEIRLPSEPEKKFIRRRVSK